MSDPIERTPLSEEELAEISGGGWINQDVVDRLLATIDALRAKNARLENVARAAAAYGERDGDENDELPHDETGDPHDAARCRTCALAAALAALGETDGGEP